ncbi:MAG: hypothetical protein JWP49_1655 [Phenylobacterium sp.]|nr:hypothetical protein [Phenylobacterium sp.]
MAKKSKNFLPRKIVGVKVPKKVRKGQFGELLASPTGQKLIAQAIVAIGAVASAKKVKDSPKARGAIADAADKLRDAGDGAGKGAAATSGALAYALGEAARSFTDALHRHQGDDDGGSEAGRDGADSKKKPTSYEAGPL